MKKLRMQNLERRLISACYLAATLIVCLTFGLAQTNKQSSSASITAQLQKLLNTEVAANSSLPGELLTVNAPKQGLNVSLAAGLFDRETKQPLHPHSVFRIASVTKTFVATAILRLYEAGLIKLDDPINRYLSREHNTILDSGGYSTNAITVRQLLTQTSGMFDYADAPEYVIAVTANPRHRWTRTEQLQDAVKWGKPMFAPGKGYHYADTNYILLGEMVERLTHMPMGPALRKVLEFKKLGLDETYLETLEPEPIGVKPLSHPYYGTIDARNFDPSVDLYGGGGLVSSTEDLAIFFRALLRGQIFRRPQTLKIMLTVPPTNNEAPGGPYAMGIQQRSIGGHVCWGHTGFWGTSVYHCPDIDVTIARHYNQAVPQPDFIFRTLLSQIAAVLGINDN